MWELMLAFPPERILAFVLAGLLLNLTPGADVMFATASGLAGGPRAGAVAGLGVGLGGLWHAGLAAGGVSALLAAHPAALDLLSWAGAGYLLWLAWGAWHAPLRVGGEPVARRGGQVLWRGFVVNAFNPKVALFVLAFLPQFVDPALGPVWRQILLLGALFSLTGTVVTAGYGVLAGALGVRLAGRMGVMNRVAAALYLLLALRLLRG